MSEPRCFGRSRSPDGAQRNPGPSSLVARFPDYASLHPGYRIHPSYAVRL
jgi:hypothetical protein